MEQHHLRQIRQTELAVGKDRIAGEDARQPQRVLASVKLLAHPLRQRVIEKPRIQLVEGWTTKQAVAVQDQGAYANRSDGGQVGHKVAPAALRVLRSWLGG